MLKRPHSENGHDVTQLSVDDHEVRSELQRVLASKSFRRARRLRSLLEYAADPYASLGEEAVAAAVFGRASFDPRSDPLVRVEFGRLRRRLVQYYETEGRENPVRIVMPARGYRLSFGRRRAEANPGESCDPGQEPHNANGRLQDEPDEDGGPPSGRSIAVLPFANLTGQRERDVFCHGLTEELIKAITEGDDIEVVSRTSAFQFQDGALDVRDVGRELGVDTILEGSVRMENNRIRVIAELTSVKHGFVIWSDAFDHDAEGALDAQAAIAKAVHDTLQDQWAPAA